MEEDYIRMEATEIDGFIHFLKACKAMSPRDNTDIAFGPRGISVTCGRSDWGFTGNLPMSSTLEFQISKLSIFKNINFDDIIKLKTKDLHEMLLYPNGCLKVKFRNSEHNDIFSAELCEGGRE